MQIYLQETFILHHVIFKHIQSLGRYIRRLGCDPNLIYPSFTAKSYERLITPNFHPPYGTFRMLNHTSQYFQQSCLELLVRDTQVLYTDFSASRQKGLLVFRRCGLSTTCQYALTPIRQLLFTIASIAPSTHMLPLFAITDAPHRRFGSSLLSTAQITLYDTATIHKYPCFVVLTYSACASARWFSASSLSSYCIFA